MKNFHRCLECGLVAPDLVRGLCRECSPDTLSDEDKDTEDYGEMPEPESIGPQPRVYPPGEDGEPIPGTYILCHGYKAVSDDPDLDKDWGAFGPPLCLS